MKKKNKIIIYFLTFLLLNISFVNTVIAFSDDNINTDISQKNDDEIPNKGEETKYVDIVKDTSESNLKIPNSDSSINITSEEQNSTTQTSENDSLNFNKEVENNSTRNARKSWNAADGDQFLKEWNYSIWKGTFGGTYFILNYYLGKSSDIEIPGYLYTSNKGNRAVLLRSASQSSKDYFLRKTGNSPISYSTLTSIKFSVVNNISVGILTGTESVQGMFQNAKNLKTADLSGLKFGNGNNGNYSKINDYSYLFNGCSNLTSVTLPTTDIANNTSYMFNGCTNLSEINNMNNFNTSKVTNMSYMFSGSNISTFPSVNYNSTTTLAHMYDGCKNLTIPFSYFLITAPNAVTTSYMFNGCSKLNDTVDIYAVSVTDASYMYSGCTSITNTFHVPNNARSFGINVTNMAHMFDGCTNLARIDFRLIETRNVTDMSYMFNNCSKLNQIFIDNFTTTNVRNMSNLFSGCISLSNNFVSQLTMDTSKVTNMSGMFARCTGLTNIKPVFNTSSVTDMSYMFTNCQNIITMDLRNFNTSNVTDMNHMFSGGLKLQDVNLTQFNTSKLTNMYYMFGSTPNLKYINLTSFTTNQVSSNLLKNIFYSNNGTVPLLIIVDKNKATNLMNYDYSTDNRTAQNYPRLNANGGVFNVNQQSTLNYFDKVCLDQNDPKLNTDNLNKWVSSNQPTKSNFPFVRWLPSNDSKTMESMIKSGLVYTAEWLKIPYTSSYNKQTGSMNTLAITYIPQTFSIGSSAVSLNNQGIQVIPITNSNSLNVGVRDQREEAKSWQLSARLSWNKIPNGGSYIQVGSNHRVTQNTNNGVIQYNSNVDLNTAPTNITSNSNIIINEAENMIMTNNGTSALNGVFDFSLGNASLVLSDASKVKVGSYSGTIIWNLQMTPSN